MTTGFRPTRIEIQAVSAGNQATTSNGSDSQCQTWYKDDNSGGSWAPNHSMSQSTAWRLLYDPFAAAMEETSGVVDTYTTTGFNLNCTTRTGGSNTYFGTYTVNYVAYYNC